MARYSNGHKYPKQKQRTPNLTSLAQIGLAIMFTTNSCVKHRILAKSLGLMIDDTLSWSAQIDKITKKVNSGLSIIRKLRDIVDYNTLIIIDKSIIQPHFDYCSQVWGCLGKVLSDKRQRLQNRAHNFP